MLTETNKATTLLHTRGTQLTGRCNFETEMGSCTTIEPRCNENPTSNFVAGKLDAATDANFQNLPPSSDCRDHVKDTDPGIGGQEDVFNLNLIAALTNEYVERPGTNAALSEEAQIILGKFGVQNVKPFLANSSVNILFGLRSLENACYSKGLGRQLGVQQIKSFFEYMNRHRYSASSIRSQYKGIEKLAKELGISIKHITSGHVQVWLEKACTAATGVHEAPKIPVNPELLMQLCDAAPKLFREYEAKLTSAVFVAAYAMSLRQSEYTHTPATKSVHNLHSRRVELDKFGMGVEFASHKGNQTGHSQF